MTFKKMFYYSKKHYNWQTQYEVEFTLDEQHNLRLNDILCSLNLDYSLAHIDLGILKEPSKHTWDFTKDIGDHIVLEYTGHKGEFSNFYNHLTGYNLYDKFPHLKIFKGVGRKILQESITSAIKDQAIALNDEIIIDADGVLNRGPKKGLINLVEYYEKIGFRQIFPEHLDLALSNQYVPMVGKVSDLLEQ